MSTELLNVRRDVGHANTKATVVAVKAAEHHQGLAAGELLDRLWINLPLPADMTIAGLEREWMPHTTWAAVERNLFRIFGNPETAAAAVADKAATADFGGLDLSDWVRFGLRMGMPPEFVFRTLIPMLLGKFNDIKQATTLESSPVHVVYRIVYANGEGLRTHEPAEDIGSRVWFETAMTAGAAKYWFRRPARVIHRLLELDLQAYLESMSEFIPGVTFYRRGDTLRQRLPGAMISKTDPVIATLVALKRDQAGFFTVQAAADDPVETKPAWRIEQDVAVMDAKGNTWHPLHSGTLFCPEAGCSLTEYNWQPAFSFARAVFQFFLFVLGMFGGKLNWATQMAQTKAEAERTRAELERTQAELKRERALRVLREGDFYPTPDIATAIREGRFQPRPVTGALLFFDLGDSTGAAERLGERYPVLLRQFMDELDLFMLGYRFGVREDGVVAQTDCEPGDARLVVFSCRWDGLSADLDAEEATRRELRAAFEVSEEIFTIFQRTFQVPGGPTNVRIGLHHGEFTFDRRGASHGLTKCYGPNTNRVQRIEDSGKLPGVAARDGRTVVLLASVARYLDGERQFVPVGQRTFKGVPGEHLAVRLVLAGQEDSAQVLDFGQLVMLPDSPTAEVPVVVSTDGLDVEGEEARGSG